jgi:hypothetical protein
VALNYNRETRNFFRYLHRWPSDWTQTVRDCGEIKRRSRKWVKQRCPFRGWKWSSLNVGQPAGSSPVEKSCGQTVRNQSKPRHREKRRGPKGRNNNNIIKGRK